MRFAVDAHAIGLRQTGNEVYIRNLLEQFSALDEENDFTAYVSSKAAARQVPRAFQSTQVSANPFVRLALDLPRQVRNDVPDILHVQYTAPPGTQAPIVTTVHDVSFLDRPDFFTPLRAFQLKQTVGRTVRKAARVITVSEFSRRAILRQYDVAPEKVVTIPNAVSDTFCPVDRAEAQRTVLRRHGIGGPTILTVGDLQPRKNHLGLFAAFEALLGGHPDLPHHLVFVGKDKGSAAGLRRAVSGSRWRERIHFTGFVEDADLVQFYGGCDLFVFPSYYEGFGLPLLEAMACGRAVACSNTTAMPEVAGGAGVLFDPASPPQMARAMAKILRDGNARTALERRGLARARQFSWQRSAALTLNVYYEVAGGTARFRSDLRFGKDLEDADRLLLSASSR
jgi:glycosyltransferase involved in cell wall biosynthesis